MKIYMIKKVHWDDKFIFQEVEINKETANQYRISLVDEDGNMLCRSRLGKYDLACMTNFSKNSIEIYGTNKGDMIQRVHKLYVDYVESMNVRAKYYSSQAVKFEEFLFEEASKEA